MLKTIHLISFCLFTITTFSQDNFQYYDIKWRKTSIDSAFYKKENCLEKEFCKTYFISGEIYEESNYKMGRREGLSTIFYKNGRMESRENYLNGSIFGECTYWYYNGQLKEIGSYLKGEYTISDFWDSTGTRLIEKGNGKYIIYYIDGKNKEMGQYIDGKKSGVWKYWFENGQLQEEINYKNNKKDGIAKGWYNDGKEFYNEFFSEDKLLQGESFSENGEVAKYTDVFTEALYPGGMKAFAKDFRKELGPPVTYFDVKGKLFIECTINKMGEVKDAKIINGINPKIDARTLEAFKNLNHWIPATNHGQLVNRKIRMPIVFNQM